MGPILFLAHAHDAGAKAVACALSEELGPQSVTTVLPEVLALAHWSHLIDRNGRTRTRVKLRSGVEIDSAAITCLFNRLQYLPIPQFGGASPKDRDYAGAELQALVASWLFAFGSRVLNSSGPRALAVGPASRRGWLALSAIHRLPIARSVASTAGRMIRGSLAGEDIRTKESWPGGYKGPMPAEIKPGESDVEPAGEVIVAGNQACGPLAHVFGNRCLDIARAAGCALLEFRFGYLSGEPVLLSIDPLPPLTEPWKITAVAQLLARMAIGSGA